MKELDVELLKKLSETPGVSGFEGPIASLIESEVKDLVDEIEYDNMGNLYAIKRASAENRIEPVQKLMIAVHMDEIGFIVTKIEDSGLVRFTTLGGFDPKTLTAQRVTIYGKTEVVGVMGSKPIHYMTPEERKRVTKQGDYYIDLGMTKEEVEKVVEVGDPITRERELIELGDCVNGKSLDNRVSCYSLIEALKELKDAELPVDLYAVFTVQEEVGLRGAQVATLKIQPDYAFAVDTTGTSDLPGTKDSERVDVELGKGPSIKILDASSIVSPRVTTFLKKIADDNEIPYQLDLAKGGGTDTAMLQRMTDGGSLAGAISIPTRYLHQVIETSHKVDVIGATNILIKAIENIHSI